MTTPHAYSLANFEDDDDSDNGEQDPRLRFGGITDDRTDQQQEERWTTRS